MVEKTYFHEVEACRLCGSSAWSPVLDLGLQALTGRFPSADETDPPEAPLQLDRCTSCGLVQLRHSVDVGEMFGEAYGYRSGINATMRSHLASIASELATRARLSEGDIALDIGCNDGTLLDSYDVARLRRIGIDPIADMFAGKYGPGLEIHADFFTAESFSRRYGNARAKAITSISMFYDLEDPGAFVAAIAEVLDDDGIWVLEQSYLPLMLEQNSFDTICHEHLEYYALAQIERLTREHGLRVFDVRLNGINGGSFQVWVCRENASYETRRESIAILESHERDLALMTEKPYADFCERVAGIRSELSAFIKREVTAGKTFYVYGASTKGNVLLQYFGLGTDLIAGCADRNPEKWGRRTPGTNLPIVSEEEGREKADYFLILPWHFRDEFVEREADFRSGGGRLVFPLPQLEVV